MSGWFKFPRDLFGDGGVKRAKPCSDFEAIACKPAPPMTRPEAEAPPLAPSRYRADLDGSLPEGHRQALARSRASNSLIAESRAAAANAGLREEGPPQTGPTPPLNPPKAEP